VLKAITYSLRLSLFIGEQIFPKLRFVEKRGSWAVFLFYSFGKLTWVMYEREKFSRFLIPRAFLFIEVMGEFCSTQLWSIDSGFKFDF